ncbi:hypothetical protein E4U21_000163 [Claviceps maximensis]|nr:hypothetical protein E4U21_000163 [Claviceps maximensis]
MASKKMSVVKSVAPAGSQFAITELGQMDIKRSYQLTSIMSILIVFAIDYIIIPPTLGNVHADIMSTALPGVTIPSSNIHIDVAER